jgi:predicted MFS family arabinose efflux permease
MLPVIVLFFEENGLSLSDIFLLQAAFGIAMVALEVPTGMVADRLGKRTSLILGEAVLFVSMIGYASSDSFATFLAAELCMALGAALYSGAGSALLYDTLKALGREDEYTAREGRAKSAMMVSFAVSNLIGGFLGEWSYRATVWATAIGPVFATLTAFRFREVSVVAPAASFRGALREYGGLLGDATRFIRRHRLVRWQITLLAVLMGTTGWLLWLYQPYMEAAGLPVWAFGLVFAVFNLFAAWMSSKADAFEKRLGLRGAIAGLMGLQVLAPLLMSLVIHPASVLFALSHSAVRGLAQPILSGRILRYTFADKRSTVLSMASLFARLFFGVTAPLIGYVADRYTLEETLFFQAALLVLIFSWMFVRYATIPKKYFEVKESVSEHL